MGGFGSLVKGQATVRIDPLFAQTVNLDEPYHVFVQPYGNASLYVSERIPTSFTVRVQSGDEEVEFSYRIVARRRGYEAARLEPSGGHDELPLKPPGGAPPTIRQQ
ncbi:MAG: hypothetical protein FJZ90_09485 [Chloroflexi bacterium]|nr:hypothetical protein [Chloroflexota bacterium]